MTREEQIKLANDIKLHIDNESELYKNWTFPVLVICQNKKDKDIFKYDEAVRLFRKVIFIYIRDYYKDNLYIPLEVRELTAKLLVDYFICKIEVGNRFEDTVKE